ncbi:circularly permutated Ras protein 1 [Aplochiton taeniatus]
MEFACSHVVCNWTPEGVLSALSRGLEPSNRDCDHQPSNRDCDHQPSNRDCGHQPSNRDCDQQPSNRDCDQQPSNRDCVHQPSDKATGTVTINLATGTVTISLATGTVTISQATGTVTISLATGRSVSEHQYDNRAAVLKPTGLEVKLPKANINVVSLGVGRLVNITKESLILGPSTAKGLQTSQSPVHCGKCSAVISCLSSTQSIQDKTVWVCEFCGEENSLSSPLGVCVEGVCLTSPGGGDVLYVAPDNEDDYQNLEDALVVFCVDISGSMSVTTEITPGNAMRSPTYVSRMQGIHDALQRALSLLLQNSPHRRVALVTFNDEVVVYGDGTTCPVYLRDWALVDYDFLWEQAQTYSTPHCIAESYKHLAQRVTELREHGATSLGPAALVSVAMASRYVGSKVVLCTDGKANIGLGRMEDGSSPSSLSLLDHFYRRLGHQAANSGVIVSVMTFEDTDCRLAEVGRLADQTGGRVNIVNIGTVATEIQTVLADNILATGVIATLLAPDGVYFPYEEEGDHKLVREIGNVTKGVEITFQFTVKPERTGIFLQRDRMPFQLQVSFTTRDHQRMTRVISQQRRTTTSSWVWAGSLNLSVLGVHCAQLCARLTMEGRVEEAQRQLRAQQHLLTAISQQKPNPLEEKIYGNWIDTMTTICDDLTTEDEGLSDEAAKVVYQMKRASSLPQQGPKEEEEHPVTGSEQLN